MAYTRRESIFRTQTVTGYTLGVVTHLGTTTSGGVLVGERTKMSIMFLGTAITSGNGNFRVDVSNDGTNWVQYNRLTDNLTNSNSQTDTRVGVVTITSNAYKMYFFPAGDHFEYIRVRLGVTTDGNYSAVLASVVPGQ